MVAESNWEKEEDVELLFSDRHRFDCDGQAGQCSLSEDLGVHRGVLDVSHGYTPATFHLRSSLERGRLGRYFRVWLSPRTLTNVSFHPSS